jgi:hypothetical protein
MMGCQDTRRETHVPILASGTYTLIGTLTDAAGKAVGTVNGTVIIPPAPPEPPPAAV